MFPYEYIVACTEESLRNLRVDTIDLQQLHVWDPGWLQRDEWKRAFEDLRRDGKIRYCGISINDHQPDSALDVVASGLIDTVQVIYNIFDQSPEKNLFPAVQKNDVGVLARVPFDEGSLTGAITADSKFEGDEFRAFYFRGDRPKQVMEHVSRSTGRFERCAGLAAGDRFALLSFASRCNHGDSRYAQSSKRGVELPRLRLRAFGGGLAAKTKKTCLEQKLLQLVVFFAAVTLSFARLRSIFRYTPAIRGYIAGRRGGSIPTRKPSKSKERSVFAITIIHASVFSAARFTFALPITVLARSTPRRIRRTPGLRSMPPSG